MEGSRSLTQKDQKDQKDNPLAVEELTRDISLSFEKEEIGSIKEFYHIYRNRLPQIISFQKGYTCVDGMYDISPNKYVVHGSVSQKRVVVQGPFGMKLSIPLDIADNLEVFENTKLIAATVSEIIDRPDRRSTSYKIRISDDLPIVFSHDAKIRIKFSELDPMAIVDFYTETYLTASIFTSRGGLTKRCSLIPTYTPLPLKVAKGFLGENSEVYKNRLQLFKENVDRKSVEDFQLNKALIVMVGECEDYSNVVPGDINKNIADDIIKKIKLSCSSRRPPPEVPPKRKGSIKDSELKSPMKKNVKEINSVSSEDEELVCYETIPETIQNKKPKPFNAEQRSNSAPTNKTPTEIEAVFDKETVDLKDFFLKYENQLPQIVDFSQGYLGVDELHTINIGESIIHGFVKQQRVVLKGPFQKQFSVPVDVAEKFKLIQNRKGCSLKLSDIVSQPNWNENVTYKLKFDADLPIIYSRDSSVKINFSELEPLKIIDCYEEIYLTASPFSEYGEMFDSYFLIPVYLPLKLYLMRTFDGMSRKEYQTRLQTFRNTVDSEKINQLQINKGIVEVSDDCDDYTYMTPKYLSQLNIKQISALQESGEPKKKPKIIKRSDSQTKETSIGKTRPPPPLPNNTERPCLMRKESEDLEELAEYDYIIPSPIDKKAETSPRNVGTNHNRPRIENTNQNKTKDKKLTSENNSKDDSQIFYKNSEVENSANSKALPEIPAKSFKSTSKTAKIQPPFRSVPDIPVPAIPNKETKKTKSENTVGVNGSLPHNPVSPVSGKDVNDPDVQNSVQILNQLSNNRSELTISEVGLLLDALQIHHAVEVFQKQTIDGKMLSAIDDDMLITEFNFSRFQVKKLRNFLSGWVPK